MAERRSTAILVKDLEAAQAPAWILKKAQEGQYNDYVSDSATPIMDLVRDATAANLQGVAEAAQLGKYDGTRAESEVWFQREGKDLFGGHSR